MTLTLITLMVGLIGLAWAARRGGRHRRQVVVTIAVAGLGFQLVHVLEHAAQAGAWAFAPTRPPFMTPWADAGAEALAVAGNAGLGNELLHLVGNVVFLVGLVAMLALVVTAGRLPSRSLRVALMVQGAHVVEHVALTLTVATVGRAIGVTTLFGALEAGPALWSLRVLAHMGLNTIATVAAVGAVLAILRGSPRPTAFAAEASSRHSI